MKEIVKKLIRVSESITSDESRGGVKLFLLIRRTDLDNKWDILFSADWIKNENRQNDLVYLINKLKEEFDENIDFVSRIVLGTPGEDFIKKFAKAIIEADVKQGEEVLDLSVFGDFTAERIFVITIGDFSSEDLESKGVNQGPVVGEVSEF